MRQERITEGSGRIVVLVPHQDDEILMCAGILKQAKKCGLSPVVVMATNGDYGCRDHSVGQSRLRETLAGLQVLGIEAEAVVFLGYADTGMPEQDSFLAGLYAETDGERIHRSHCSEHTYALDEKPEFHMEEYGCHGAYTRNGFIGDLDAVLKKYRPDMIFTTSDADTHGDHSGLYHFLCEVLETWRENGEKLPVLYSGIVHSKAGDEIWPVRSKKPEPFTCPPGFEESCGLLWDERVCFPVPETMQEPDLAENEKSRALAKHVTALKPDAVDFLYSFIKTEEIFWKIAWNKEQRSWM